MPDTRVIRGGESRDGSRTAVILLAAGQSRRFGMQDKLLADLNREPLICMALRTVAATRVNRRIAVTSTAAVDDLARAHGFETVRLPPGGPQSASLAAGIARIASDSPDRILVTLADMPFIQPGDLTRLLDLSPDMPACAARDGVPMPPAVFPGAMLDQLAAANGDRGAASLLRGLPPSRWLSLPPDRLIDIDTQADLSAAARDEAMNRAGKLA